MFNSEELWLLCCTSQSITLNSVHLQENIWKTMLKIADDLYHSERPPIPMKLHPLVKNLKSSISSYRKTHCNFVVEVPRLQGFEGTLQVSEFNSPYAISPSARCVQPVVTHIESQSCIITTESKLIFTEGHRCLRQMARELLMYMINCKD